MTNTDNIDTSLKGSEDELSFDEENDASDGDLGVYQNQQEEQQFLPGVSSSASSDDGEDDKQYGLVAGDCGSSDDQFDDQSDDQFLSDSDTSADENSSSGVSSSLSRQQLRRHQQQSHESRLVPYENLTTAQTLGLNFAMEHRIFLKALLGLLNEREKTATETGMNDPNIIKCGPLKKASHLLSGVWKVKYVEIRRGMLTYFEDVASSSTTTSNGTLALGHGGGGGGGGDSSHNLNQVNSNQQKHTTESLVQKNIPLDSNECQVMPVKIHRNGLNMAPGGAIFELKVGNTGRLWLARTRAERSAWIEAINEAMVGGSVTQSSGGAGGGGSSGAGGIAGSARSAHGKLGTVDSRSPYRQDLRLYLKTKSSLKNAKTKEEYVAALSPLVGHDDLSVPVKWIMLQVDNSPSSTFMNLARNSIGAGTDDEGAFVETDITRSVDQLWRDLRRDSITINDELFLGDSGHGPELILGALTRDIVTTSRSESNFRYAIPESKAVAYAR